MQWFCWHVPGKMSLAFLCLVLVCNTGKDNESCLVAQQGKLFLNLFLHFTASCIRRENKKEKQVAVLATAELPAKSVDLAAINLTELVNGMLNTALRGTKKLFSLLSVTSYSSFAFHKVSVTIYNISNVKNVDPGKFPMHYCYCLNNVTNDLTDFTALLVDIIGNSTSYLTEIFKSTSILSVRQSNDSDCIYICVMTGQTGRNLSDFWEMLEKSPVINYTFSSNTSSDLDSIFSSFMKLQEDPNKTVDPPAEHVWTFKNPKARPDPLRLLGGARPHRQPRSPAPVSTARRTDTRFTPPAVGINICTPCVNFNMDSLLENLKIHLFQKKVSCFKSPYCLFTAARIGHCDSNVVISNRQVSSAQGAVVPAFSEIYYRRDIKHCYEALKTLISTIRLSAHYSSMSPATLGKRWQKINKLYFFLGCPQAILKESRVTSPPVTLIVQKINPCVMELCRFFQLCLCVGQRRYSIVEAMRYCVEYYSWFLKNASYVCERVKRFAYSHTLKQKCLKNICTSV
ncbi:HHLA1 protein, partial [Hydrobates tethys]|nr:HHLA1 protein [Oceanodroma tethys]